MPFATAVIGLVTSIWFGFHAVRELKREKEGHSRNAAMIHIAMVSMLAPFCLIVIATHWP